MLHLYTILFLTIITAIITFADDKLPHSSEDNDIIKEELSIYPIIMPMIVPAKNEVYLCTSVDLSQTNETFYIRGFDPKVNNGRIHHMALAGSSTKPPKTQFNIWNCGNKGKPAFDPNYPNGEVFPGAPVGMDTTLYLWGMGGKRTMLPEDTGFKVKSS